MDPKKNPRKPRLERRNAVKHIDYEASTSSSSVESSPSPSLHTRSLDLSDKMSFRVEGIEGEFDIICRTLGLSGPEDFAIPSAAWEARKVRSISDILPRSRLQRLDSLNSSNREELKQEVREAVAELCDTVVDRVRIRDGNDLAEAEPPESDGCGLAGDGARGGFVVGGGCGLASDGARGDFVVGGGLKGVRPPVLKPPPSMRLPVIDNSSSTWDLLRDFAPNEGKESTQMVLYAYSDEEEEHREEVVHREVVKEEEEAVVRLAENAVLSESCSFTTSNDDDSSSSTTEPSSNISPNARLRPTITCWEKGELLGRGSFGSVYEGITDYGYFFAVKEVSLLDQGAQGRQSVSQLEQEIDLLSKFEHENIVKYLGTDKDESKLYIFLELVTKGSLQSLYQKYNLRDSQVSAYTRQILLGLKYLHDRNVVHRDIKCANILVCASGSVKLADFGLAKATKLNDVHSSKGTACWMAPEVVKKSQQGYGLPADIWSLGCTVLEMLTQKIPYSDLEWMQAIFRIGKGVLPSVPDTLSKDARDFILQCLQVNPNDRPTAAELLDHPFVKKLLPTSSGSASPYHYGVRS
ncbi:hypothetical protein FNV43_RR10899 [Rhamnella rubrinervis]|uniref:mitogen-activated protein kinase kinase kinase n=1 Tax=Rhamnella rubrinervis TaxID=2594499 RepID=A0A8K0H597_9ROSA|nr:hypothetical protein FNV43_RR10899 [Rhamnella rubrinervis]